MQGAGGRGTGRREWRVEPADQAAGIQRDARKQDASTPSLTNHP
jgi:hypothetical protein